MKNTNIKSAHLIMHKKPEILKTQYLKYEVKGAETKNI